MKKIYSILFITFIFSQSNTDISGNIDFYTAFKTSNEKLLKLPYRLANLKISHQKNDIQLIADFSLEHQLKNASSLLSDNSTQDFDFDLREFYLSYFTNFGELRLGKQIYNWGLVEENSPLDNINAYDYHYMFLGGSHKKIGTYSISMDIYLDSWKAGLLFSPIHNANRIPINEPDFPIELTIVPKEEQILTSSNNKFEYGAFLHRAFESSEIRFSYFNGYDRLFNFSGINIFNSDLAVGGISDISFIDTDIVFGYRKTKMIGVGGVLLFDNLSIKSDIALFKTQDENESVSRENPNSEYYNRIAGSLDEYGDTTFYSYPIEESAEYLQYTIQLDYDFPYEIKFITQLAGSEIRNYKFTDHSFPEDVDIPQFNDMDLQDIDSEQLFSPGMGTSIATLSPKVFLISLEKKILDEQLKLNFVSLYDIDNPNVQFPSINNGSLLEIGCEYNIMDDLKVFFALTKISGDDKHDKTNHYSFNQMEDFSHCRLEIKYFY